MKNDVHFWPATGRFVVEEARWNSKVMGGVVVRANKETIPASGLIPIKGNPELEKRFRRKNNL